MYHPSLIIPFVLSFSFLIFSLPPLLHFAMYQIRNIFVQFLFQIIVLAYLLLYGFSDFSVESGSPQHLTIVFNTFVFCQIFNEINARLDWLLSWWWMRERRRGRMRKTCYIMWCHIMSYHVIMSCHHVMSCHVISCHVMLYHVISCHIMSCHVISCHIMSSCHVIMSYHVTSCHVMSCHCFFDHHIVLHSALTLWWSTYTSAHTRILQLLHSTIHSISISFFTITPIHPPLTTHTWSALALPFTASPSLPLFLITPPSPSPLTL